MDKRTCSIDGCEKPARGRKGYCSMHYTRWKRHGDPEWQSRGTCEGCGAVWDHKGPGRPASKCVACKAVRTTCLTCGKPAPRTLRSDGTYTKASPYCSRVCRPRCAVEGCDGPERKRGWCASHYSQWQRIGEVKPFTYKWATEYVCVVCGADVQRGHGRRKHCSGRCQMLDSMHKGSRPKFRPCVRCGVLIDLLALTPAGQFRRTDVKICGTCRRARSLRHKVSVSELVRGAFPMCGICGELVDMDLAFPDPGSPSIDHVLPYAHGGSHDLSNLQLAHLRCNHIKSDRVDFIV